MNVRLLSIAPPGPLRPYFRRVISRGQRTLQPSIVRRSGWISRTGSSRSSRSPITSRSGARTSPPSRGRRSIPPTIASISSVARYGPRRCTDRGPSGTGSAFSSCVVSAGGHDVYFGNDPESPHPGALGSASPSPETGTSSPILRGRRRRGGGWRGDRRWYFGDTHLSSALRAQSLSPSLNPTLLGPGLWGLLRAALSCLRDVRAHVRERT